MEKSETRQIVNIVNFLRGYDPRGKINLVKPLKKQLALVDKYNFRATFLLQYDALIDSRFSAPLLACDRSRIEIGVWYEYNRPLVEKAGLLWRGRYSWDWHSDVGMSVGYTPDEREKIIDVLFNDFKKIFGHFPKVLGCWAFDAHSIAYANEKYGLDAACNCRDQWGTDGYNMWGGYYGQAYYLSKFNAFAPAQAPDNQIDVPVFRMLGADPVLQYDFGLDLNVGAEKQRVVTLEPVYPFGGGSKKWVDRYLKENFNGKCLSFGYAQAGQENSFGWKAMRKGLKYQFKKFDELQMEGKLTVETLGESGRYFRGAFSQTPQSAIVAERDDEKDGKLSVWYDSKNYRANLYAEEKKVWLRDLYLFRDGYKERYLDSVCTSHDLFYDNLPVVDGLRFSGGGVRGGVYPFVGGTPLTYKKFEWSGDASVTLSGTQAGKVTVFFEDDGIRATAEKSIRWVPVYSQKDTEKLISASISKNRIDLRYNGYSYFVTATKGELLNDFSVEGTDVRLLLI